jgi:hypothetical protein
MEAPMKPSYRWRCFACDKPNERFAGTCAACGFPANASGADIDRARASRGIDGVPARWTDMAVSSPPPRQRVPWSNWRKGAAIGGAGLLVIGAIAWRGSFSWNGFALALLAVMFGAILLMVACVARDLQQPSTA